MPGGVVLCFALESGETTFIDAKAGGPHRAPENRGKQQTACPLQSSPVTQEAL